MYNEAQWYQKCCQVNKSVSDIAIQSDVKVKNVNLKMLLRIYSQFNIQKTEALELQWKPN